MLSKRITSICVGCLLRIMDVTGLVEIGNKFENNLDMKKSS